MKSEIKSIVNGFALGAKEVVSGGQGAVFEMWLLLKIAARLKPYPFHASLCDADDKPLISGGSFTLRGGPGRLGAGNACHVSFTWAGEPHEIHANTEFLGRSTTTHEIDLAVIPKKVGARLRSLRGGRPTGQPRLAIECKYKAGTGTKDEARQVVARLFDITFLDGHPYPYNGKKARIWPNSEYTNGFGETEQSYLKSFKTCFNSLCRIGSVTKPTGIFLQFNSVASYANLGPGTLEVNDFLNDIEKFLARFSP
jgi:hypothetical protein